MVLVDYIGIFFTCCNTFVHILYNTGSGLLTDIKLIDFGFMYFYISLEKKGKFIKLYLTTIAHQNIRKDNKLSSNI